MIPFYRVWLPAQNPANSVVLGSEKRRLVLLQLNSQTKRGVPMKWNRSISMLLLGIWLILTGLIAIFGLSFANSGTIMALLALLAGAIILMEAVNISRRSRTERAVGMILLGIWLLLTGLLPLFTITFEGQDIIMALLALAAGVLILIGR
jgi:hypothetical protein